MNIEGYDQKKKKKWKKIRKVGSELIRQVNFVILSEKPSAKTNYTHTPWEYPHVHIYL